VSDYCRFSKDSGYFSKGLIWKDHVRFFVPIGTIRG